MLHDGKKRFMALVLLFVSLALHCSAGEKEGGEKTAEKNLEKTETALTGLINGKSLEYDVKTGLTPVHNADGEEIAHIFSTSYLVRGAERERPLLFLYNGGPGVASIYLHMGAFGPKGFLTDGPGIVPPRPPYAVEDNPDSLLDVADLIFVDPVGTGYSRIVAKGKDDEDKAKEDAKAKVEKKDFWGVEKDIDSIAEFVRVWLTENDRWGAPVFLGGESYGGLRTAGLAGRMADIGVAPSGVVLVSPVLSYMDVVELETRENHNALVLLFPSLAMTAHYHERLDAELQAMDRDELGAMVAEWCEDTYLPALRRGNRLPDDERRALAAQISRYCGIPAEQVLADNLAVTLDVFAGRLLRDKHLFLGAYDGRMTAYGSSYAYPEDPVNSVAGESYKTAFMRFMTGTLGLKLGRRYHFASEDAFEAWDFTQGERGLGGFPSTVHYLGTAMRRFPGLKIFAALGRYDLVTPPYSVLHSLSRLKIPPERVEDIMCRTYEGGHMMYTNIEAKKQLSDDVRAWIRESVPTDGENAENE